MNRVFSFTRYQLRDYRNAVLTFYVILITLALIMLASSGKSSGQSSISGGSIVFVFVLGLNCFKTSFLFSQANNLSRKTFYLATLLSLVGLAIIMGFGDFIFEALMGRMPSYRGIFEQIYGESSRAKILWSVVSLTFAGSLGWMITMLYYRSTTLWKVIISVSPVVVLSVFTYLNSLLGGRLGISLGSFLVTAMGFAGETPNPYPAILSFTLGSIMLWLVNYVLMYKVPVKA